VRKRNKDKGKKQLNSPAVQQKTKTAINLSVHMMKRRKAKQQSTCGRGAVPFGVIKSAEGKKNENKSNC